MRHDAVASRALPWKRKRKPTIEAFERRVLLATFAVTSTFDSPAASAGDGTLRGAILALDATGDAGGNIISFNLPAGVQTIAVSSSPLPAITVPVTIDGTTQTGYSGTPLIVLNGAGAVTGSDRKADGLDISAGKSTVRGLVVNGFSGEGIALSAAGGNTITGDYIGTDATGTVAVPNGLDGVVVLVNSNNNVIANNLISGNNVNGIYLNGTKFGATNPATSGNTIAGNKIGVDVTGTKALGNGLNTGNDGIFVANAPNTTIGGTGGAATRNIISGNEKGIELYDNSDGMLLEGNYIGTDATGAVAIPNQNSGIVLRGISNSTIGGLTRAAANVISGNHNKGIDSFVIGSGNLLIEGNLIGTDATGTKALGNTDAGVYIGGESDVTIGGLTPAAGNVISGNVGDGITTFGTAPGLLIEGNKIGTAIDGTTALGNGGSGVYVSISGVTVGGTATGAGNIIANNGATDAFDRSGVVVTGGTKNVPILNNSIYNSRSFGIEDQNQAPNQAAPVLTSAVSAGNTSTVAGSLTTGNGTYLVQFFSTPTLNASGHAEGESLLGSTTVTVANGTQTFSAALPFGFVPGSDITATATNVTSGTPTNTSPFSAPLGGTGTSPDRTPPTLAVSAPSTVTVGSNLTYTFTITNPSSLSDTGVAFADPLPAGTAFVSGTASTGVPVVVNNGVVTSAIGTLFLGESVTVTVTLAVLPGAVPAITNTAYVTADVPAVAAGVDSISATTAVTPLDDVGVAVAGPSGTTLAGSNVVYTVTVSNAGPSPATGVVLADTLPAGVALVSATSSDGTPVTTTGTGVTETIASLAAGGTVILTITVATNGGTPATITDVATANGTEADANSANNSASATTAITPSADLEVRNGAAPAPVLAGDAATLTAAVANNGPSPATGVVLTFVLPAGLTFVSGTAAGGAVTVLNGVVTAPVGTLAAGGLSSVSIVVRTTIDGAPAVTDRVAGDQADIALGNNAGSIPLTVLPMSDLAVQLAGPTGAAIVGQPLTYTAIVTNNGPSAATHVVLKCPFFAGGLFVSTTLNGGAAGAIDDGAIVVPIQTLAAGQSATVIFTVEPTADGTYAASATVGSDQPDRTPGNNTAGFQVTVQPESDLSVQLAGPAAPASVGGSLTLTAVVTNAGPSAATGVVLTSPLFAGAGFVSASVNGVAAGGTPVGGAIAVPVGSLGAGDSVTVTLTVLPTIDGTFAVAAAVGGSQLDLASANNNAAVNVTVRPSSDLAVQLAGPAGAPPIGQSLTYTAVVTNVGPSAATGVVLTSPLFAGATFLSAGLNGVAAAGGVSGGSIAVPVGALAPGQSAVVTLTVQPNLDGTFAVAAVVAGDQPDATPGNNTAGFELTVTPESDLSVAYSGAPATAAVGQALTYTAVVTNIGPSAATGVVLTSPLFAGATFVAASVDGVAAGSAGNGAIIVPVGALAAGQSATVTFTILPAQVGAFNPTITVAGDQPDIIAFDNTANTLIVLGNAGAPASTIEFSAASYTVDKAAGTAIITFNRVGDLTQAAVASFSTAGGTAAAGRDYIPVAQVVTFAPGVNTATVTIPILDTPSNSTVGTVLLTLAGPTNATFDGGASTATAQLQIFNSRPVLVGPTITEVKLIGPATGVAGVELDFSEPLDPTAASNAANYTLTAYPSTARGSLAGGTIVPVTAATLDPATGAVLLTPATPLPINQFFLIDVNGSRAGAVTDLAGNPLYSSIATATAGSDYLLAVARGNNLQFADENGTAIHLKLTGPGAVDVDQTVAGLVGRVQVLGTTGKSTLLGSASRPTDLGVVGRLGHFKKALTRLSRPYHSYGTLSYTAPVDPVRVATVDTLTAATTTKPVKGKATAHARAVPAVATTHAAKHPRGAAAAGRHAPR